MKKIIIILSVLLIAGGCGELTTKKQEGSNTKNVSSSENNQASADSSSRVENNSVNADLSPHLAFMGVPIDGTLSGYVSRMKQKGFTYIDTENGVVVLNGDFAGYKNCMVGVTTLKGKDLVSKITVIFPKCDAWSSLSDNYFSLKGMLTEKYGKPSECVEKFQDAVPPTDDGSKMYSVEFDRCKYYTTYKTEKGAIQLSIEHNSVVSCYVMLSYYDKINYNIIRAKVMNDL